MDSIAPQGIGRIVVFTGDLRQLFSTAHGGTIEAGMDALGIPRTGISHRVSASAFRARVEGHP
jgi:hypothetical protein